MTRDHFPPRAPWDDPARLKATPPAFRSRTFILGARSTELRVYLHDGTTLGEHLAEAKAAGNYLQGTMGCDAPQFHTNRNGAYMRGWVATLDDATRALALAGGMQETKKRLLAAGFTQGKG